MAKASLYNAQGEATGSLELNDAIFGVKPKVTLIHQVYTALRSNAREPWADTKNRGEVSGGGKKPWQQKGTGRARHGSIRSPIWRGGGITFGPLSIRNYKKKINKQMSQLAVKMCLSDKLSSQALLVIDGIETTGKTKELFALRGKLPGGNKATLVLVSSMNDLLKRAVRNLPGLHVQKASDVNVMDILHHQTIVVTKDSLANLETRLS